ncbi:mitochondrial inner membrane protease ATP23-like [Prosopis cineraria]|uniref:mitochondrial inner membrane protease ATP23-like n=1 Tax=Prosopis cineraria TaxID=364024 RepID=UPI00240EE07C|nr:mitochondrial inner membrane protease ATP23-like [Prosopis cineraria]
MEEDKRDSSASHGGGKTVKQCESMIQTGRQTPIARFLMESMEKAGCPVGNNFFKAVNCTKNVSGGYVPGYGIILCMNKIHLQDEVNQVIAHELIHALDECRAANLDWTNCAHHACSEIRANHLSGDCHFKRELLRGYLKLRGQGAECVKRRALSSLSGNPHCSGAAIAEYAMESVWDICYNDTQPFDRAP